MWKHVPIIYIHCRCFNIDLELATTIKSGNAPFWKVLDLPLYNPVQSLVFPLITMTCESMFQSMRGRRDLVVVGFITTYATSAYHHKRCEFESHSSEVYSIQYYVIKFVSNLRQVDGFLRVLWFPPLLPCHAQNKIKVLQLEQSRKEFWLVWLGVLNATFNNISVISWKHVKM
jgi:hypothetical protein